MDSRRKGNAFELDACRLLSAIANPDDAYLYARSPAHAQLFHRRTTTVVPLEGHWNGAGDLVCRPFVSCPFTFECKKYKKVDLAAVLAGKDARFVAWWRQARRQADRTNKFPALVFAWNRSDIWIATGTEVEERQAACVLRTPIPSMKLEIDKELVIICQLSKANLALSVERQATNKMLPSSTRRSTSRRR